MNVQICVVKSFPEHMAAFIPDANRSLLSDPGSPGRASGCVLGEVEVMTDYFET